MPRLAGAAKLISILKQRLHIAGVEFNRPFIRNFLGKIGEIEFKVVPTSKLISREHAISAFCLGQSKDSAAGDLQRRILRHLEAWLQLRIDEHIDRLVSRCGRRDGKAFQNLLSPPSSSMSMRTGTGSPKCTSMGRRQTRYSISAGSASSIISRFIDAHLLDEIAREHRKGRRLYVVTTNIVRPAPKITLVTCAALTNCSA
jgi:hypothetical protein